MNWIHGKTESGHEQHLLSGDGMPFPVIVVPHRDGKGWSVFARAASGLSEKVGKFRGKSLPEVKSKVESAVSAL